MSFKKHASELWKLGKGMAPLIALSWAEGRQQEAADINDPDRNLPAWVLEVKARSAKLFAERGSEPLSDCRDDVSSLIQFAIEKAWYAGGDEMKSGLESENNVTFR